MQFLDGQQVNLDELDQAILDIVGEDGRRSIVSIAAEVGVGRAKVKKTLDALLDSGVCVVEGAVNPERIGYRVNATVRVTTKPAQTQAVVDAISRLPGVFWIGRTDGRANIDVEVFTRETADLFELFDVQVARIPGVLSFELFLITRRTLWRYRQWRPPWWSTSRAAESKASVTPRGFETGWQEWSPGNDGSKRADEDLDDTDRQIIELLQEDGRRPASQIAETVGTSPTTVKMRIDRLRDTGVCRVVAALNPQRLGFEVDAMVGIAVKPGRVVEVADKLVPLTQVSWVGCTTGARHSILLEVRLRSSSELLGFMSNEIGRIPGVQTVESYRVLTQSDWLPGDWRPQLWPHPGLSDPSMTPSMALRRKRPRPASPAATGRKQVRK